MNNIKYYYNYKKRIKQIFYPPLSGSKNKIEHLNKLIGHDNIRYYSFARHALLEGLKCIDLRKDDSILIPSFICRDLLSSINSIGAEIKFYDVDKNLYPVLDHDQLPKAKVIIVVNYFGFPQNLDNYIKYCKRNKAILIEDNAELMGGVVNGRRCGSFGDCSILSFYANKQITTGEGGAILTDSEEVFEKVKYYRNLCFKERRFIHDDIGHNFRMTNMQAALGLSQLGRMTEILKKRQEIADIYYHYLQNLEQLVLPLKSYNGNRNVFWVFGILLNKQRNDGAINQLARFGVGARPFFSQLSQQGALHKDNSKSNYYHNSRLLSTHGLYLPSGLGTSLYNIEISAIRAKKVLTEL